MLFRPTVKIDFGKGVSKDFIISATDELVRSFIYELDVRNGVVLRTRTRSLPREARMLSRSRPATRTYRYPRTHLQPEVADLFNFAGQAVDNPPLAFLSYYQTLEYFMPAAVQQSALRSIRRELRDPMFDSESDTSMLKIISATERSVNIPESSQVRTLVTDFARKDRLEEFFKGDWGDYFTKRGPIHGVPAVSANAPEFVNQVADRVYQIRNRIVHAKDDPKYEQSKVLLPQSAEAQALGPDIQLVRLLAMEAILAGQ